MLATETYRMYIHLPRYSVLTCSFPLDCSLCTVLVHVNKDCIVSKTMSYSESQSSILNPFWQYIHPHIAVTSWSLLKAVLPIEKTKSHFNIYFDFFSVICFTNL